MSYFSNFPSIYYDFNIGGVNEVKIIKDISINVRVVTELLSSISIYEMYDIKEGETPDIVSSKIYGSPYYHWIIMLLNERFDYINDWPMTSTQLARHVDNVYGVRHADDINHYRSPNGHKITSTSPYYHPDIPVHRIYCNLNANDSTITSVLPDAFAPIYTSNPYIISGIGLQSGIVTVQSIPNMSTLVMSHPATKMIISELSFAAFVDPSDGATPVTNFEYESEKNEFKRSIKLIDPKLMPSIMNQLKALNAA